MTPDLQQRMDRVRRVMNGETVAAVYRDIELREGLDKWESSMARDDLYRIHCMEIAEHFIAENAVVVPGELWNRIMHNTKLYASSHPFGAQVYREMLQHDQQKGTDDGRE